MVRDPVQAVTGLKPGGWLLPLVSSPLSAFDLLLLNLLLLFLP